MSLFSWIRPGVPSGTREIDHTLHRERGRAGRHHPGLGAHDRGVLAVRGSRSRDHREATHKAQPKRARGAQGCAREARAVLPRTARRATPRAVGVTPRCSRDDAWGTKKKYGVPPASCGLHFHQSEEPPRPATRAASRRMTFPT